MAFPYKHFLVIGATSGIGLGMAERLVQSGAKVTVVGRRKERLDAFVARHGSSKANSFAFDISKRGEIPQFAADIMNASSDIDCVFLNAGVQHEYDFSKPESVDLATFEAEMNVNFLSFVALTHAFLPFLIKREGPASFIFTGSNIALVPAVTIPAYSASKSALNVFVLCLRGQLRDTNVKVIEISPPPVQTEIHDTTMGAEVGRQFGMPLVAFSEEAYAGLAAGKDEIVIGSIGPDDKDFKDVLEKRRGLFDWLTGILLPVGK